MSATPTALEQAFLDDIVAHPEDPSLWLILSDWLDERDDPRGELVRLTWQIQYEPGHRDFKKRQKRVQVLLAGGMRPVRPRVTLDGIEFAWIPPGAILVGSPKGENGHSAAEKQQRVALPAAFWVSVFPVTQAQWRAVVGTEPSEWSRGGQRRQRYPDVTDADLEWFPVERVSWDHGRDFCRQLSDRLQRPARLPTEAEWEYACRAGTTTAFHFGPACDGSQANTSPPRQPAGRRVFPALNRPSRVGSYPPNAWGLYDMHGNVREWCLDEFQTDYRPATAEELEAAGWGQRTSRTVRGGCWGLEPRCCRAAYRDGREANFIMSDIGVRVVLPAA